MQGPEVLNEGRTTASLTARGGTSRPEESSPPSPSGQDNRLSVFAVPCGTRYRLPVIRPPAPVRRRALLLLLAALALAAGPSGCQSSEPKPVASEPAVDLSPIPAPAGLIAEAILPAPDATWAKARIAVGGPALFLPVNAGTLIANLLGLPAVVASDIDGNVPMLGAVIDPENGAIPASGKGKERTPPRAAIGIHVKSGGRFVDQLTRVEGARFQARMDAGSSITLLEAKAAAPAGASSAAPEAAPSAQAGRPALGVLGNYLLLGATVEDLRAVGPYLVRSLSRAPAPKEDLAVDVPRAAIDGPILTAAKGVWEQVRPSVAASGDAGAATVAGTAESLLAVLGDLERARITVVLDEAAHLRVEGTPREGGGAASKAAAGAAVGDVAPLLEVPADAMAALLVRESAAGRQDDIARQVEAVVRLIDKEVPEKDRAQITAALRGVSEARGDWFTAALRWEGTGPTVMARSAVSDEAKLGDAVEDLVALAKVPSIKSYLDEEGLRVSAGKHVVERLPGDARRVRFEREDAKDKGKKKGGEKKAKKGEPAELAEETLPRAINLVYLIQGGSLYAAAGYEPDEGMRRIVAAPGGERLGQAAALQKALGGLGADTSYALVVDPLRILAARAGKPAPAPAEVTPVVLAAGARPGALWARVDLPTSVIKELVRRRGAL